MTEAQRLVNDIVNVEGENVQERREAIAQTWIDTFRGPLPDYHREREVEKLTMVAAVVASGLSNREGAASSIAGRALEIARSLIDKARS